MGASNSVDVRISRYRCSSMPSLAISVSAREPAARPVPYVARSRRRTTRLVGDRQAAGWMLACQQSDGSRRSASLRKRGCNADQHRDDLHKVDLKFQDECFHQYLAGIDEPNKLAREHFGKRNSYQMAPLFVGLSRRASPCSAELDGSIQWPIQQRSATGRVLALKKTSRGVR
jgi:hypothetical protein